MEICHYTLYSKCIHVDENPSSHDMMTFELVMVAPIGIQTNWKLINIITEEFYFCRIRKCKLSLIKISSLLREGRLLSEPPC